MSRNTVLTVVVGLVLFVAGYFLGKGALKPAEEAPAPQEAAAVAPTPAEGYTVHVTAPHVVDGHAMGPFHHYCKMMTGDPLLVCLIYESTDPNAPLVQVEWMVAKSLTRASVPLEAWNRNWHDHAVEIASGRVQVEDLAPEEAAKVAEATSTTDGLIIHFYMEAASPMMPTGATTVAQAVSHVPLREEEFKAPLGQ